MLRRSCAILAIPGLLFAACAADEPDGPSSASSTSVNTTTATVASTIATTTSTTPPAPQPEVQPSTMLVVGDADVEVARVLGQESYVDVPVYLGSKGEALQFDIHRDDYGQPLDATLQRVTLTDRTSSPAPPGVEFDWNGFIGFTEVTVRARDRSVVANEELPFCPNGEQQRLDATGPDLNPYPTECGGRQLSLGAVWGIGQGWATPIAGYSSVMLPAEIASGMYTMEVAVAEPYATWLGGIEPVSIALQVKDAELEDLDLGDDDEDGILNWEDNEYNEDQDNDGIDDAIDPLIDADGDGISDYEDPDLDLDRDGIHDLFGTVNGSLPNESPDPSDPAYETDVVDTAEPAHQHAGRPAGTDARPDPATVPDLRALPAYGISTTTEDTRDLLNFSAVTWNAGPAPMVIDGFRSAGNTELMDAMQAFYADDLLVGHAPIGSLEYHRGGGHDHWHFQDFSRYELVSTSQTTQLSGKQSWCLANNYPVDLTLPGVRWTVTEEPLSTSCGGESALWVREVLAVGWGDEYVQSVSGQSFDITDLPNGVYTIRITANPEGNLYEVTDRNNVSERIVRLGGVPGARTVGVPKYRGIDTEDDGEFGGAFG
jgi:hypothetical protein